MCETHCHRTLQLPLEEDECRWPANHIRNPEKLPTLLLSVCFQWNHQECDGIGGLSSPETVTLSNCNSKAAAEEKRGITAALLLQLECTSPFPHPIPWLDFSPSRAEQSSHLNSGLVTNTNEQHYNNHLKARWLQATVYKNSGKTLLCAPPKNNRETRIPLKCIQGLRYYSLSI